jgi:hypothetical protein
MRREIVVIIAKWKRRKRGRHCHVMYDGIIHCHLPNQLARHRRDTAMVFVYHSIGFLYLGFDLRGGKVDGVCYKKSR